MCDGIINNKYNFIYVFSLTYCCSIKILKFQLTSHHKIRISCSTQIQTLIKDHKHDNHKISKEKIKSFQILFR